ncbi:hypothetical protein CGJ29_23960 [Vibrio parahaemolyticus]|uniref:hypothetical protein n=1 Tax=Vibrio parahaemolyticus TaxID=670 RepID=UPI00111EDB52|nr:hypothetical protein [Vibrio parahaemolyticus]TOF04493.1 hypothetical protein CGJ29_23960 [Vibrio parahaemolyticus]
MAYDLVVGDGPLIKDNSVIVSCIEFASYSELCSLHKRNSGSFLTKLVNQFSDSTFDVAELSEAQESLFELMLQDLSSKEMTMVYQLISSVSYALHINKSMYGIAD